MSANRRAELARAAQQVFETAEAEGREPTTEERWQVHGLLAEVDRLKASPVHALDGGFPVGASAQGPGDIFVKSEGFQRVRDPGRRGQRWSTGVVEVGGGGFAAKGTLLEAPGGGGGAWVSTPQLIPGAVQTLFQPLTVEALFLAGQAPTSSVRYVVEGTAVSGAAGVAEAGEKPQSTLGFDTADEAIKKVATVIITSDELLEDVPAIQTFVNGRLQFFVQAEVERQLLRGAAGGNEVQGLLTSRGVPVYAGGTAAGNKAEQLFKAMNGVRGSAFVEPDWLILSPADYEDLRLLKDSNGQLYGGGPFFGPYGNGAQAGANGQVTGATDVLWQKPTYVTSALGAGTALVGTRSAAQVWSRGGPTVEATNSHAELFTSDQVAIRCERRLALTVFRAGAFCEVRLA